MVKNLPIMQETWVWTWSRKIRWRKEWRPSPVFLPGEFHGQRSLVGCRPCGCRESDTTERLALSLWAGIDVFVLDCSPHYFLNNSGLLELLQVGFFWFTVSSSPVDWKWSHRFSYTGLCVLLSWRTFSDEAVVFFVLIFLSVAKDMTDVFVISAIKIKKQSNGIWIGCVYRVLHLFRY